MVELLSPMAFLLNWVRVIVFCVDMSSGPGFLTKDTIGNRTFFFNPMF